MINFFCRHYKTSKPCFFNKNYGDECVSCRNYSEYHDRILFIKLDATGDVLRSASLLPSIIGQHNAAYIAWLTRKESVPLVGMMKLVDEVVELSEIGIARVMAGGWDYVYSLSNDLPSASIATVAKAKHRKIGYWLEDGVIKASNSAAEHWLEMAAFDRLKRENQCSYQELMLAIVGQEGATISSPLLEVPNALTVAAARRVSSLFPSSTRPKVAVNVGAGDRWPKKMLDVQKITEFIDHLHKRADVDVLLVGGAAEVEKIKVIAGLREGDERTQPAPTTDSLPEFVALLTQADAMFCGDTLALHVATAIDLPTVAVFGPTSVAEISDFDGLIKKIWAKELNCLGCYGDCTKVNHCMSLIAVERLVDLTLEQLSFRRTS
jgi:ADP-heptose:LPS heptosyltransferase